MIEDDHGSGWTRLLGLATLVEREGDSWLAGLGKEVRAARERVGSGPDEAVRKRLFKEE